MLHCCWLIDPWKKSRDDFLQAWASLQQPVTLWHAGQIETAPHPLVDLRDVRPFFKEGLLRRAWDYEYYHRNHAACADLVRYEVLYREGGGYFDLDVLPHPDRMSAEVLAKLLRAPDITFGSLSMMRHLHGDVEIRFICSPPQHDVLLEVRELCAERTEAYIDEGGHSQGVTAAGITTRTGPIAVTEVLQRRLAWLPLDRREEQLRQWLYPFATHDDTYVNMAEHLDQRFSEIDAISGYEGLPPKRRCAPAEIPGGRMPNVRLKHPFVAHPGRH